ncbi:MAG: V-type ATP synthase subunit E family protein [Candidatus Omnitrophica bacterium]|nr:V-type ATP synthase subunit E family protein [Candidatus Omnitrophota bacterium]
MNRLISEIERATSTKFDEIVQQAKSKAEEILDNARKTAEGMLVVEKEKAQQLISIMRQRAEAAIKIELRKMQLELKKEFVEAVLGRVKEMAKNFRNDPEYKNFLKKAVLESVAVIDLPEIIIKFTPPDAQYFNSDFEKEIIEICKNDLKKNVSLSFVKSDFNDLGVIGTSKDGFIMYDNTFSARLQRLYDTVYSELVGEKI